MHIKKLISFSYLLITLTLSNVIGKEGSYIGGQISGISLEDSTLSIESFDILDLEFNSGFGLGGVAGYDYGQFRLEAELTYRSNDIDMISMPGTNLSDVDADMHSLSLMVNGFYDVENKTPFTPYIGGGIGFANVDLDSEDDRVFAYQLGIGVGYAIDEVITLDLGYRYFATSDPEFLGGIKAEYSSHNLLVGIRVTY